MNYELKVSVQTAGWYNENPKEADKAFQFIKGCGFEVLDFNIDHTLPSAKIKDGTLNSFYDAEIDELLDYYKPMKEAMERHGIAYGQAHAPFPMYVEGNDKVNEYLIMVIEKECAICQYLGCPALVVHPYSCQNKEREKEINLNMYRKLIPAAKKYRVKICLENMFQFNCNRATVGACGEAEEACWYIDTLNAEAGEDVFGYCFDIGHANLTGRNIRREIQTLGDRITILHIHDNDGARDLHQIPYTTNCTDWEGFIEGLKDINYRGTLNFETFAGILGGREAVLPILLKTISGIGGYFQERIGA